MRAFITPQRPSAISTFRRHPHTYSDFLLCLDSIYTKILKPELFKYKRQYRCFIEQSLTSTLFNNRITSRLKTNTRDHNAFIAGVVNSIFKFHPTLWLSYWSVIWSAELLTRPQSSPYRSLPFSLQQTPISSCITFTLNRGNNSSVEGRKAARSRRAIKLYQHRRLLSEGTALLQLTVSQRKCLNHLFRYQIKTELSLNSHWSRGRTTAAGTLLSESEGSALKYSKMKNKEIVRFIF